jgi:hypothetical protein
MDRGHGYLTHIAVGSASTVWGVSTNVQSPSNNIFRWTGSDWDGITRIPDQHCGRVGRPCGASTRMSERTAIFSAEWLSWDGIDATDLAVAPRRRRVGVNAQKPQGVNNVRLTRRDVGCDCGHMIRRCGGADGTVMAVNAQQLLPPTSISQRVTWTPSRVPHADFGGRSAQIWGVNSHNRQSEQYLPVRTSWQTVAVSTSVGVGADGSV